MHTTNAYEQEKVSTRAQQKSNDNITLGNEECRVAARGDDYQQCDNYKQRTAHEEDNRNTQQKRETLKFSVYKTEK